jgi:hypothetical protein
MNNNYIDFLNKKKQLGNMYGFDPISIPDYLFDFQKYLLDWIIKKGRGAIFADCGLGKTIMELVWADNIVRKENKPILILAPLAVTEQTIREGEKFNIECERSKDGKFNKKIIITNYERLHYFNPEDFIGVACDESSILKSFDGKRRTDIIEFMKKTPYRTLWTATAAPNDYIELGSSSEALGELGYMDMLNRFFKNDNNTCDIKGKWRTTGGGSHKWRFKGHAEKDFWRWLCSWAMAVRKPSDIGFDDKEFILPNLLEQEHILKSTKLLPGMLIPMIAANFREERAERKNTINIRCEKAASLVKGTNKPAVIWCHLNTEGDLLKKLIPDAIQISGRDSDDSKEEKFLSFINKTSRVLIIKPKIGAFGLNWQHCNHIITFASHSYEQYYQAVRRCWRFGQKENVKVDIILSEGEMRVMENMKRKSVAADKMFTSLLNEMNNVLKINKEITYTEKEILPEWL